MDEALEATDFEVLLQLDLHTISILPPFSVVIKMKCQTNLSTFSKKNKKFLILC